MVFEGAFIGQVRPLKRPRSAFQLPVFHPVGAFGFVVILELNGFGQAFQKFLWALVARIVGGHGNRSGREVFNGFRDSFRRGGHGRIAWMDLIVIVPGAFFIGGFAHAICRCRKRQFIAFKGKVHGMAVAVGDFVGDLGSRVGLQQVIDFFVLGVVELYLTRLAGCAVAVNAQNRRHNGHLGGDGRAGSGRSRRFGIAGGAHTGVKGVGRAGLQPGENRTLLPVYLILTVLYSGPCRHSGRIGYGYLLQGHAGGGGLIGVHFRRGRCGNAGCLGNIAFNVTGAPVNDVVRRVCTGQGVAGHRHFFIGAHVGIVEFGGERCVFIKTYIRFICFRNACQLGAV